MVETQYSIVLLNIRTVSGTNVLNDLEKKGLILRQR
jgi:hypothetical protein